MSKIPALSAYDRRLEDILQAYPLQEFRAGAIGDTVDDGSSIVGWFEVDPKRAIAERCVDHFDDGVRDGLRIRIRRPKSG
jgi:hypothetical protein